MSENRQSGSVSRVYKAWSRQLTNIRVECTTSHLEILLKRDKSHHHLSRYRIAWSSIDRLTAKHYTRLDGKQVLRYKFNFKRLNVLPKRIASYLSAEEREMRFEIIDNPAGHSLLKDIIRVGALAKIDKFIACSINQVEVVEEDEDGGRRSLKRSSDKKQSVMVNGKYERGCEPITLRDVEGNIVCSIKRRTINSETEGETGYYSDYNPEDGDDDEDESDQGLTDDDYSTDGRSDSGSESDSESSDDETEYETEEELD